MCNEIGRTLPDAEFLLYGLDNNIIGSFVSDVNGLIVFPQWLPAGDYQLREIRSPANFVLLEHPIPITLTPGETKEIEIPNEPMRGKIQIIKRAAEANSITGDRAGAVLEGAVFEIVNEDLEVVDEITTCERGMATSRYLPLGRYAIREIESPDFWLLYDGIFYAEIRLHGDLIRFEVLNHPADINVTVEKRGNQEALAGDLIRYDFYNISNDSNIELHDFFWRDRLPSELQLERLVTGTWSDRLRYRVVYTTNLNNQYRVWRSDLLTTTNHELDISELDLRENEHITSFRLEFGTVPPGFREADPPRIYTRVQEDLPHEHRIINRTDVGGRVGNERVYENDSWVTVVFATPRGRLPLTGLQ